MNKKISEITRNKIINIFLDGFIDVNVLYEDFISYNFLGRLNPVEFLNRIYPLSKLPSSSSLFANAEDEICEYTNDKPNDWVFKDERFELQNGNDSIFLNFLCTIFHPEVRNEGENWKKYLDKVKELLRYDGYELYVSKYISGESVYGWRVLTDQELASNRFVPFSQRYNTHKICKPVICWSKRKKIFELMCRKDLNLYLTTETGFNYYETSCCYVMKEIKTHYIPKAYNDKGSYEIVEDFETFIMKTSPLSVFDVIEIYSQHQDISFTNEVNVILSDIGYQLIDGKIMMSQTYIKAETSKDFTLRELIIEAEENYKKQDIGSKQRALEKIWDAFEKLRTYYNEDKKKSVSKIIKIISEGDIQLEDKLNSEFLELGYIGNNYQIRHFETGKIPITDIRLKEYWYTRCLALINLAIKFIER